MTLKMPNKPQRLSTLPATLTFNDYSDYEGAPESSDFRALPYRLSTLRLCLCDFGAGRRTPGSPGGAIRADPAKNRPAHAGHARTASGHARTRTTSTTAPEAPRREHRRQDMQVPPPRERPTEGHWKRHTPTQARRGRRTTQQDGRRTKEK